MYRVVPAKVISVRSRRAGGFDIKGLFNRGVKALKEGKYISRGLKTASDFLPQYAMPLNAGAEFAEKLGFGRRRRKVRKSRARKVLLIPRM